MDVKEPFKHIIFDPLPHTYKSKNIEYTSVTTLIGKYSQEFQEDYWAEIKALEYNIPVEELLELWRINKEYACLRGTEFHFWVQTFLRYGRQIKTCTDLENQKKQFLLFYSRQLKNFDIIETELLVGDDSLKVAGTMDLLAKNSKGEYFILDWKTNTNLTAMSFGNMKPPLTYLVDNDLNHYFIQLNMYKYLLELHTSIKIKNCFIAYFPPDTNYKLIACKDMKKEVCTILGIAA